MLVCCTSINTNAQQMWQSFTNPGADTTLVTEKLIEWIPRHNASKSELMLGMARELIGIPYGGHPGEKPETAMIVQMDSMNCVTMVETAMALAMTIAENRSSWRDMLYNMEQVRYRNGRANGYGSRLHYVTDWAIDLAQRGILEEVTAKVCEPRYSIKTLDYMSRNRDKYPELADSANLAAIRNVEMGYMSHRSPYIKPSMLKGAKLQDGDILALTSTLPGLDVAHIGVAVIKNGVPYLIHASSKQGEVIEDSMPLGVYLSRNRQFNGVRVFRLK